MVCYSFGPFELDPEARMLRRQGQPVVITAKIFELLLVLVQHRGRVVTKDELLANLWPDTTVEEANLAQNMSMLRKALDDSPKEHRFIVTVPGRGYQFVAPVVEIPRHNQPVTESDSATASVPHRSWSFYISRAAIAVLLLGIAGYVTFQKPSPFPFYSSTPLTSYLGSQICPTFAPDGERVAFAWDGENQDNFDIYVKQVGGALPLQLTNGPEPDISPAWSPDGRTIAFLHVIAEGQAEVLLIPAIAPGPARKLGTVTVLLETYYRLRLTAWSPDGKWIALSDGPHFTGVMSLVLLSVETGECRRVTVPPVGYDDFSPVFSPDCRRLAFVRYSSIGASAGDLYLLSLSNDLRPVGKPERLTFYNRVIASPVWTTDSRALLSVRHEVGGSHSLWRIQLNRNLRVEPLPIPAENSLTLALSPRGNRLVYTRDSENVNIWAVDLNRNHRPERIRPQITSTWGEENPQFSPDGRRIAFQSSRSGRAEIWVCDRDGSHPRQLTHLGATVSGFARWSPDAKKIAFHSRPQGLASLYVTHVDGGQPEQLTSEMGNNFSPSWSHDGKWIYFVSRRTGQSQIWRMPATGGAATQISKRSGWCPLESKDGRFLYYVTIPGCTLRAVPLSGGPEKELLSGLAGYGTSYAPAREGIYLVRTVSRTPKQELAFFDSASHRIKTLAEIARPVALGLALSPEENMILYSQVDRRSSDLMLVDNFH